MQQFSAFERVELKYCERCGGLWLRAAGMAIAYCPPCSREIAELPPRISPVRRRPTPLKTEPSHAIDAAFSQTATSSAWSGRLA